MKQETVSGSGISWAICKSAPSSRQITMPAPHHSVFTGRMPFLPPNQQRQSTEGKLYAYDCRKSCTFGAGSFDNCSRRILRSSSISWSSLDELSEWGSQRLTLPSTPFTATYTVYRYIWTQFVSTANVWLCFEACCTYITKLWPSHIH